MRYVTAYLLAVLGGKAAPAAADIEKILSSVGIEADSEKLKKIDNNTCRKNTMLKLFYPNSLYTDQLS
ncbi:unnamed protein product [Leptidea sinapis]|uniref:Large ribosomal subunit protein P2 n=1 Tax=Leptidea sinapis TaxID=189913 RepID=A0A5E4Q991_9NEOP|nr:unnamed protein product [Leptidea sinapis]